MLNSAMHSRRTADRAHMLKMNKEGVLVVDASLERKEAQAVRATDPAQLSSYPLRREPCSPSRTNERTKKITAKEKGTIERQNRSTVAESYTRRAFSARNRDTCGDRCCLDDLDDGDGRNTVARRCLAMFGTRLTFALRCASFRFRPVSWHLPTR